MNKDSKQKDVRAIRVMVSVLVAAVGIFGLIHFTGMGSDQPDPECVAYSDYPDVEC
jgi:hypothetical protein